MMINRLGASRPGGMIYALRSDIVTKDGSANLTPGNVQLHPGKRPRPLVCASMRAAGSMGAAWNWWSIPFRAVSYTHLTLPTNREV